jgi:hypothetical protein
MHNSEHTFIKARTIGSYAPISKKADSEQRVQARAESGRERARRLLIFRHMIQTTGKIHFHLVHTWMYQPSEAETQEHYLLLQQVGKINGKPYREAMARLRAFDAQWEARHRG